MIGTSIVVVTWNCAPFISRFIDELSASLREVECYEVLICDNASPDKTGELLARSLPQGFRLVQSSENLGFARGNNALIRQARYDNIVLLNPDVFGFPEGFWVKVEAARLREAADVAFVKLLNADGSYQDCIGEFPSPSRAMASILGKTKDFSKLSVPTQIEVGIMAFLLTTRETFDEVGLIDEDFHMYCEDVEWCYRVSQTSRKVVYLPELSLTHLGGASSESRWKGLRKELVKYRSELLFIRKHHRGASYLAMLFLNLLKRAIMRIRMARS